MKHIQAVLPWPPPPPQLQWIKHQVLAPESSLLGSYVSGTASACLLLSTNADYEFNVFLMAERWWAEYFLCTPSVVEYLIKPNTLKTNTDRPEKCGAWAFWGSNLTVTLFKHWTNFGHSSQLHVHAWGSLSESTTALSHNHFIPTCTIGPSGPLLTDPSVNTTTFPGLLYSSTRVRISALFAPCGHSLHIYFITVTVFTYVIPFMLHLPPSPPTNPKPSHHFISTLP